MGTKEVVNLFRKTVDELLLFDDSPAAATANILKEKRFMRASPYTLDSKKSVSKTHKKSKSF